MDKPVRKIIRLDNYDYSKKGLYFITICTVHKNELLWATDVGDGAPDVPFRGSSKVWIFYKVEWVNETGELPRFVRLSRFA